jgi:uncharacterized alkaline shock family protein YloU
MEQGGVTVMSLERQLGDISIDNSVVGTIAAIAAQEVEGVVSMGGKFSLSEMLGRKDSDRGVKVEIQGGRAVIDVDVKIEYGRNMYDAAHILQKKVKDTVEQMTGLVVEKVNVKINGIIMKEKPQER